MAQANRNEMAKAVTETIELAVRMAVAARTPADREAARAQLEATKRLVRKMLA